MLGKSFALSYIFSIIAVTLLFGTGCSGLLRHTSYPFFYAIIIGLSFSSIFGIVNSILKYKERKSKDTKSISILLLYLIFFMAYVKIGGSLICGAFN